MMLSPQFNNRKSAIQHAATSLGLDKTGFYVRANAAAPVGEPVGAPRR